MNPHALDPTAIQSALVALHRRQNATPSQQNESGNESGDRPLPNWNLRVYRQLASTNLTLWNSIQRGAPSHTAIIAQEQTQGKGQRGRDWISAPGGLYLSAALHLNVPVLQPHLLTLSTAWGIATQIRTWGIDVGLKWPNDVVVTGRKLGGILIETRTRGDRLRWVCIGVGLNWSNPVPPTGITLHSLLNKDSSRFSINDLAALTLTGIATGISRCQQDEAGAIARDYETLLVNRGQLVSWTSPTGKRLEGVVVGVNQSGELRVQVLNESSKTMPDLPTSQPSLPHELGSPLHSNTSSSDALAELTFAPGSLSLGYSHTPP